MTSRQIRLTAPLSLACLAGAAQADRVAIVLWNSEYISGDTVRVWADVFMEEEPGFSGFASSVFDIVGDDALGQSIDHDESLGLGRRFQFPGASPGTDAGDDILAVDEFQLPLLFDEEHDSSSVIPDFFAFEYRITDFTPRTLTYTSRHLNFDVYLDDFGTNVPYAVQVVPTSFEIRQVPLPTAGALAGAGLGLAALRRRRDDG